MVELISTYPVTTGLVLFVIASIAITIKSHYDFKQHRS